MAKKTSKPGAARLADEAYPELNATLYQSNPAEYFRTRLAELFSYLSRAQDADAEPFQYSLGVMQVEWHDTSSDLDTKLRYAAMESSILLHHAGETLLRLYLAHAESPKCPWLSVAKLRNFVEFKTTIGSAFKPPLATTVTERIALVFLGGRTAQEAEVDVSNEVWDEAVSAYSEILSIVSDRLLSESNLYNAAKHGLVGVPLDSGTLTFGDGDERVTVGGGPAMLYLSQVPASKSQPADPDARWTVTAAYVRIDATLMLVDLIARAIASLWASAKRKYCGLPGEVCLLTRDTVWAAAFAPIIASGNSGSSISYQIPVKKPNDAGILEIQPTTLQLNLTRLGDEIVESYDRVNGIRQSLTLVSIQARASDFSPRPPSGRTLFSFSPSGFSVV